MCLYYTIEHTVVIWWRAADHRTALITLMFTFQGKGVRKIVVRTRVEAPGNEREDMK